MYNREKSDTYLRSIGPRPLTEAEHRKYVEISIEEGSLGTGKGVQDYLLASMQRDLQAKKASPPDIAPDTTPDTTPDTENR